MRALQAQRFRSAGEMAQSGLLPLLACPVCEHGRKAFAAAADSMRCGHCGASFPLYRSGGAVIPWLFPDPGSTLLEWKARFNGFLQSNLSEQFRLSRALEDGSLGELGRKRISRLLRAKEAQRAHVLLLLEPLGLEDEQAAEAVQSLRSKLPKSQGLSSYYNNIFRDWAWNNGENEEMLAVLEPLLEAAGRQPLGRVLTLGAGACRLPYDLHNAYSPDLSVVLDINPLLLFLASRVIHGEPVQFCEFPIAPLDEASFAVTQTCRAPETTNVPNSPFAFILADGLNPPFKPATFDTVVTPWLIDIIPQDLREFVPRVNRLLRKGGIWLNTGSLAFFHKNETWRYGQEEVIALVESAGFQVLSAERRTVRYLHSPHSAHGRMESVFSFSARKTKSVPLPPRYEYLPQWILNPGKPIPDLFEFSVASSNHLLHAQVLAAIDGKRNIEEIGSLVAKQYGLEQAEAANAVQRILMELYEEH